MRRLWYRIRSARTRLPTYSRLQNRPDATRSGRSAFPDHPRTLATNLTPRAMRPASARGKQGGAAMTDLATPARADIERRLHKASHEAQREFPVVGSGDLVTGWDIAHCLLDSLIDEWCDA